MTVSLKHAFTSNVADSGDTTLVQPSNWNAEHTLTAAANTLLGAVTSGPVVEITCTSAGRDLLDDADASAQRTTLGLGTIATQNSNNVSITGGSISSLTDFAIGAASVSYVNLFVAKNFTGGGTAISYGELMQGSVLSDVTTRATGFHTVIGTQAAAFTLNNLGHFLTQQGAFGAGSTVNSQTGYSSDSSLIGATNNFAFVAGNTAAVTAGKAAYGFYSSVNTASGGGTTWAFYGAGTANSYFGGGVGIGSTVLTNVNLRMAKSITGGTTAYGVYIDSTIQSDVTAATSLIQTNALTAAASFTVSTVNHFYANQGVLGASSAITTQNGFFAAATLIGATTNYGFQAQNTAAVTAGKTAYGFYSAINIATGGGTTWAFYSAGTAPSFFAGNIGLGTTGVTGVVISSTRTITGSTIATHTTVGGAIQTDVTNSGQYYRTIMGVAASATLNSVYGYLAQQATWGAGATVTEQFHFASGNANTATRNYGFYVATMEAVTSGRTGYGVYSGLNVATGGGVTWAFYGAGTAWSYFAGPVVFDTNIWVDAPAPTSKSTTATLTAAELKTSVIETTGTSYTLTLPTGTDIDAGFSGIPANVNIGFDFSVVNTASGTITIAVNTGVTSSGALTVDTGKSAIFRLRRTAANTYVVYRLA